MLNKANVVPAVALFFILPLIFCAVLAPFLQASNSPGRISSAIHIIVANFDGSTNHSSAAVGSALIAALSSINDSGSWVPTFDFVDPSDWTADSLKNAVMDTTYYAAIWVPAGTSVALDAAQQGAAGYKPNSAIQFGKCDYDPVLCIM